MEGLFEDNVRGDRLHGVEDWIPELYSCDNAWRLMSLRHCEASLHRLHSLTVGSGCPDLMWFSAVETLFVQLSHVLQSTLFSLGWLVKVPRSRAHFVSSFVS